MSRTWLGFLQLPLRYLMTLAIVVLVGLAALAFFRVIVAELELTAQKQGLERDIEALRADNAGLKSQVQYLQTDDAIEKLAREELGWTKPGDTSVVVIRPPTADPTSTPVLGSPP
ncbi:MAG TPA: septum formation initiator family protein [Chloroflexota bacterium]|nr:septum formation initiator family protein [Chloroflexota bacterium]